MITKPGKRSISVKKHSCLCGGTKSSTCSVRLTTMGSWCYLEALKKIAANKTGFNRWLNPHYEKNWIIHFARPSKNHHRNIKYLGRYLKRPALSMSRLKHYDGKEVVFSYLNHATKQYQRFTSGIEDFIKRLVQHIPDTGFRMIRYYGFLATRVRAKLLPTVTCWINPKEKPCLFASLP